MDRPDRIAKLAVLDAVPIAQAFARCNARFALEWWHWFFFAPPAPRAERAILAIPTHGTASRANTKAPRGSKTSIERSTIQKRYVR
jgi:hypothetical protein